MATPEQNSAPDWESLAGQVSRRDPRGLARIISWIENEKPGISGLFEKLSFPASCQVVGLTGAPGVGKSSLANLLIESWSSEGRSVAVLCVDPSSPFHSGALLGDRLRMDAGHRFPGVFIRSMASRGALGGLNAWIIEITDLLRAAGFDRILVETVGVGQNEVDIASLSDTTVLVLAPGLGDDVQAMKSGILEIADIFAVNIADLPGADDIVRYIRARDEFRQDKEERDSAIVKTIATRKEGIVELMAAIAEHGRSALTEKRRAALLTNKAWRLLVNRKMRSVDRQALQQEMERQMSRPDFQLYRFVSAY